MSSSSTSSPSFGLKISTSTMFSQRSLLVGLTALVVVIFSINQGHALQCYHCNSWDDEGCENNATNVKAFRKNCTDVKEYIIFKNPFNENAVAANRSEAECVEIKGIVRGDKNKNETGVLRTCLPTGTTDKLLKEMFKVHSVTIGSTKFCTSDFCNSSSNIYAGISSLIISTILLFLMK